MLSHIAVRVPQGMMLPMRKGIYQARLAAGAADLARAQRLRQQVFRGGSAGGDADPFDAICRHVLVEEVATGTLVCCYRLLPLSAGSDIGQSYAAQFYDVTALGTFDAPMIEIGRFCSDPTRRDPDILRLAWAMLTRMVDDGGIGMLFGCSSFRGTDAAPYRDAFALLAHRHIAPKRWFPRVKAPAVVRFAEGLKARAPDLAAAMRAMPPLLRTYLAMGGWVSDHAVVDRDLNTLHVFTGLEITAIPPARARLLRAVAG